MKAIFRSGLVQGLLANLIWAYMTLVGRTNRWTVEGEDELSAAWDNHKRGLVFSCWHSRILLLPVGWMLKKKALSQHRGNPGILISLSRDGEFVARAAEKLGLEVVRGSAGNKKKREKDKGGAAAIRQAGEILGREGVVCITVDGPRGPRQRASLGTVLLAQKKGAKIVTYAFAASPAKRLNSWDRFVIPFPFGKGAVVFGPVIDAPRDVPAETIRVRVEEALNTATKRAEDIVGGVFEPAEPIGETVS